MMRLNRPWHKAPAFSCVIALALAVSASAQSPELATVVSKPLSRTIDLPGEIEAYQMVSVRARVAGFVEKILVDRGSIVKTGQLLVELSAPEMQARIAESRAKVQSAQAGRAQAEAQLATVESTRDHLKKAA